MFQIEPISPKYYSDVRDLYGHFVENTVISFEYEKPTLEDFQQRIEAIQKKYVWLICLQDQKLVGYAYGGPHRGRTAYQWSTEVSVYVDPQSHRLGIASALYSVLEVGLELMGFQRMLAGVSLPNPASQRFHRALGFEPFAVFEKVGYKFDQWVDTEWLVKALSDQSHAPESLRPFVTILEHPEYLKELDKQIKHLNQRI